MDGSPARPVPVELGGVDGPTVLTRFQLVRVDELDRESATAACLRGRARSLRATGLAVERVGVTSESVTLRIESGRALFGCDDSPGPREANRRWCDGSYGRLFSERLRDPRLGILCTTRDGKPMGFAWVQPAAGTRYVAVEQPGYTEVYELAGGLPVRVATTTGVSIEGSRATFALSEHDRAGRLLRRYRLEAVVAG